MMEIKAQQFVTSTGRQVLTDNGQQGMGGVAGIGSTTEKHQGARGGSNFCELRGTG